MSEVVVLKPFVGIEVETNLSQSQIDNLNDKSGAPARRAIRALNIGGFTPAYKADPDLPPGVVHVDVGAKE